MKKTLTLLLLLLFAGPALFSQEKKPKHSFLKLNKKPKIEQVSTYPDSYLDTVDVSRKLLLNDYAMFGIEYGVSRNSMIFTPSFPNNPVWFPEYFGVTFTQYGKLIGSPIVGFQVGAFYGHEGYEFAYKRIEDRISYYQILNATKVEMKYVEVPFMGVGHYDMPHLKLQLCLGPYAGYRLSIHRSNTLPDIIHIDPIDPELVDNWASYEKRFDYGIHGGAGFGIIFDPFEFQVNLRVRYSWGSLWEPNYNSEYYYRYAYPFDFMLTGGLHFHISRRYGRTRAMLRREARERVFNPKPVENEHNPGPGR